MKKLSYFLFFVSALILLVSFIVYLFFSKPILVRDIYTSVNVTLDSGGFDLNGSALVFGKATLGGSSTRSIIFTNNYSFPLILKMDVNGTISPMVFFEDDVIVNPHEMKKIYFSLVVPQDAQTGLYDGGINIMARPL